MITDRFRCKIEKGDWILYIPVTADGQSVLRWGQIEGFMDIAFTTPDSNDWIIKIVGEEDITQPHRCIKFTEEEMTMRKLQSEK